MEQSGRLAARHLQGTVWFLQVNTSSFRAFAQYCLVLPLLLSPGAAISLPVAIPGAQPAVLGTGVLQLPIWNTPDSGQGYPFTQPKLGAWTRNHPFVGASM